MLYINVGRDISDAHPLIIVLGKAIKHSKHQKSNSFFKKNHLWMSVAWALELKKLFLKAS
jgi:hypothetical protein